MIRMATVWDRAAEVMRGRASILISIAFLTVWLPNVLSAGLGSFAGTMPGQASGVSSLLGLLVFVVTLFGSLALIAVASDPDVDQARAYSLAGQRLLPAIGLTILLGVAMLVLFIPFGIILAGSGLDVAALRRGHMAGTPSGGAVTLAALYVLALLVVLVWLGARLVLFSPVVLNERRGIGTFARSWELTRGLAWRIVGVLILFAVLILVASLAVQTVAALIARLLVGSGSPAVPLFVGALFASVVSAGAAIVQSSFLAQLYNAVTGREAATAFE